MHSPAREACFSCEIDNDPDKTATLGTTNAQLPFSEGRYELLNSCNLLRFTAMVTYSFHLCSRSSHHSFLSRVDELNKLAVLHCLGL